MADELATLTQFGYDVISLKCYMMATCTIFFYDYLLTLGDEIKYAWNGQKSWTFWLFIINRYFPITYQVWQILSCFAPDFGKSGHDTYWVQLCAKTSWYGILSFGICTFLAQVVLTLRAYAVTMKSIPVVIGFGTITVTQISVGIWLLVVSVKAGAKTLPSIPGDAFWTCIFVEHRSLEVAFTALSLSFDFLAFSLIMYLLARSRASGHRSQGVLEIIAVDAMLYFMVIFTSHFVLAMTLYFGQTAIKLLPAVGNVVYLPVMISRIMLSLKKAADSQSAGWSLGETYHTHANTGSVMKFARPAKRAGAEQDGIPLQTYSRQ